MSRNIEAAVMAQAGQPFENRSAILDGPAADEIVVKIEATGICHTDIGAQSLVPSPAVLGHEGMGTVEEVGSNVASHSVGDRVVLGFGFCNQCPPCHKGHPFACDRSVESNFACKRIGGDSPLSFPNGSALAGAFFQQSSFATHSVAPARTAVKVESDMEGWQLAPLGCGVMTGSGAVLNSLAIRPGEGIAIFGTGTVGLSAVMAARLAGANPIIAVDVVPSRLEIAQELGATHAFDAREGEVDRKIREVAPRGLPYTFESSGNEEALKTAVEVLAMEGTCGIVTVPHYGQNFDWSPYELFVRAGKLQGIFFGSSRPRDFIPRLVRWCENGDLPYTRLIERFDFADINKAIARMKDGSAIKPVLQIA